MKSLLIGLVFLTVSCFSSDNSNDPKPLEFNSLAELKALIEQYRTQLLPIKVREGWVKAFCEGLLQNIIQEISSEQTKIFDEKGHDLDAFRKANRALLLEWKNGPTKATSRAYLIKVRDVPELPWLIKK